MVLPPTREETYRHLENRANHAALRACDLMTGGSREYEKIKHYTEEYMIFRYAADAISGQTDSALGELNERPE